MPSQPVSEPMQNLQPSPFLVGKPFLKSHQFSVAATFSVLCVLPVLCAGGCDLPERPALEVVDPVVSMPAENPVNDDDVVELEPPSELADSKWETWDAYFINKEHVGYSHVQSSLSTSAEAGDVHFNLDHRIYQINGRATVFQRLLLSSNETKDGRLVGFDGSMHVGLNVTRVAGTVEGANLVVELRDGSGVDRREVPWEYSCRGMFAVEQSLRAKPMRENGETRSLKMLISGQYTLATAKLRCSGTAIVPVLDGSEQELIEINVELQTEGSEPLFSAIWTDSEGRVLRTYSSVPVGQSMVNIIAYRTDRETATDLKNDDLIPVSIPVDGKMERPSDSKRVAYSIKQLIDKDGQVAKEIKPAPGQYVRAKKDGVTQILVSRQEEKPTAGFIEEQPAPTRADRRPSFFIDSRADIVTMFADAAIGERKLSDLEMAIELAGTVSRNVLLKPEKCGLEKASEIARVAQGDCIQRSVVLAAMLRAKKIPSRIAIGLKFLPASESSRIPQRMVSHVWTMAYIRDHWVHLDAANKGLAAADRLMFESTNLSGEDQNEAFRSLNRDIGRMEIEIMSTTY